MGAAVATTIGRGTGVVYQFVMLFRGELRLRVRRAHFAVNAPVMKRLLRISLTGIIQYSVATASWIGVARIVALFGSVALAGYTIATRLILASILVSWGLSQAAATLVGQCLGARKPDRAERAVWLAGFYNIAFLSSVSIVFWVLAKLLIGFFTTDRAVALIGSEALRFFSLGQVFAAYGMVFTSAFNGAGDTDTPTYINFICYWVFELPLAYALAHMAGWGPTGVYVAVAGSSVIWAGIGFFVVPPRRVEDPDGLDFSPRGRCQGRKPKFLRKAKLQRTTARRFSQGRCSGRLQDGSLYGRAVHRGSLP